MITIFDICHIYNVTKHARKWVPNYLESNDRNPGLQAQGTEIYTFAFTVLCAARKFSKIQTKDIQEIFMIFSKQ